MVDSDLQRASEGELSIQEAADMLNMSCRYVLRLIEVGGLACRRFGDRGLLYRNDVVEYKMRDDERRQQALDALVA